MRTFLLTWNPTRWPMEWPPPTQGRWSCGRNRRIEKGDRLFFLRQGVEPRGLLAAGFVTKGSYLDTHWDAAKKRQEIPAVYIRYRFDRISAAGEAPLPTPLLAAEIPWVGWRSQSSGVAVPPEHAAAVESLWEGWARDALHPAAKQARAGQRTADVPAWPKSTGRVSVVSVEALRTEHFEVSARKAATVAERREQKLVRDYHIHLEGLGHRVGRHRYEIDGRAPLFCDLFDETARVLLEAKADTRRESIRMAVGQLLDYRRLEGVPPRLAVLLRRRPPDDAIAFLRSVGIGVVYRAEGGLWTEE